MTEYTAQCRYDEGQRLVARGTGASIALDGYAAGNLVTEPYLSPDDARIFARGILALADEVDGGEAKGAAGTRPQVGNRVRVILGDPNHSGDRFVGRVGTLIGDDGEGDNIPFLVRFGPGEHGATDGQWYCAEVEPVDEPAAAAPLVTTPGPSRATLLEQARQLLNDSATFDADDLIKLADYLAGDNA
ncbi:hypothetical protein OG912_32420 [Streptomyces sp. NBC_00464]|uniref:hypothetical protein n=1 Tax=Streptomyces sp. NBC_00464 TaxID=2975751 RepID=UPI002E19463A